MILAMDPSVSKSNATGVALFNPVIRRLVAAHVVRPHAYVLKRDALDIQRDIAEQVVVWALANAPGPISVFVSEMPFVYPGERDKNPNTSLVPLAALIGHVSGMLSEDVVRRTYYPRQWKGTIDGDEFLGRISNRLDSREEHIVNLVNPPHLRHNALDAVGLGLHFLGRLGRQRAVHNESSDAVVQEDLQ